MRIISGSKRAKKILLPNPKVTRPLRDSVKENIFNLINHNKDIKINLENRIIFDFFSGSGSFGMECLSRGAKYVCFIEKNKNTHETLKKNLSIFEKKFYQTFQIDFFDLALSELSIFKPDIIFLDPPYKINSANKIFEKILEMKNNLKNCLIIFHTFKKNKTYLPKELVVIFEKNYGLSQILFIKANI